MKKIYLSACLAAFLIGGTSCCNKQILNRHFSVKLNRHMIFETLRL